MNTNESAFQYAGLILRHLKGDLNPQEQQYLDDWLSKDKRNSEFLQSLKDARKLDNQLSFFSEIDAIKAWDQMNLHQNRGSKIHQLRSFFGRWKYAAAVLLIGICASLVYYSNRSSDKSSVISSAKAGKFMNDIPAGGHRASLQLSDGSVIALNNSTDTSLSHTLGIKISRKDGQLIYQNLAAAQIKQVSFNTVSTPRGGEYKVLLPDGSKVWLNSSSSLTYPTAFKGTERIVKLSGEAYFEVAKKPKMPFKVIAGDVDVKVLGTHFNVKAYVGEKEVRTTLLEGSVKVSHGRTSMLLVPGQESLIIEDQEERLTNSTQSEDKFLVQETNTEDAIAWKNGEFSFNNEGLAEVMKQLSRWYDAEISYSGKIPEDVHFTGKISRYSNISKILTYIELTGGVHFKIEGRKVLVSQ